MSGCALCNHDESFHILIRDGKHAGEPYCRRCYAANIQGDIHEFTPRKESVKAAEVDETSEIG